MGEQQAVADGQTAPDVERIEPIARTEPTIERIERIEPIQRIERIERVDLGEVPYPDAIDAMRGWVDQRRAGEIGDRLVLLSHPPVITYGSRTPPAELPVGSSIPLVPVDRGGQATYHGPGQLIGYLVLDLRDRGPADIVRWVEHGLVEACALLGFETVRRDTPRGAQSLVGVWTPAGEKLVSIGMLPHCPKGVGGTPRAGVTSHGFALNVTSDLTEFTRFTACGLPDVAMTSLAEMAAAQQRPAPDERTVRDAVAAAFGAR
ncbi:lipoyl(octanoyl) transferase LipB [Streptomyces odontomachi]|uniref:lipoyl(octanoyl) transferase LipB n=1 Tax=Streptomyces odontomachi TaxID=2944940 RepID=UPI00210AF0B2|nr:lipoyl(octanoyl) transferase LipB [Streptomyces sp. ODS25]